MGVLPYQTALATVQDALLDVIALAHGHRHDAVATTAALAAVASRGAAATNQIPDRSLRYVTADGACWIYRKHSTATASATVIVPSDAAGGRGRWLKTTALTMGAVKDPTGAALSALQTGYLKSVKLYLGEMTGEQWDTWILSRRPSVVLKFLGEEKTIHANQRGALTEKRYNFELWAVSFSARPDAEAERGPDISSEAAKDPGVIRMLGDLEYLLDGLRGVDLGVDGVDYLLVGEQTPAIEDLQHREFLWSMPLDVRVTIGKEDPPTRYGVDELFVQAQDAQLHAQETFDPLNYLVSGLEIATGAGFSAAPSDGSAFIDGTEVSVTGAPAHVFTASRVTYRDLDPGGTFTYVESYSDDREPAVTDGALRIGLTITDFAGITEDRILAASSVDVGPNNQIIPEE